MKLFWVSTKIGTENWFVIASNKMKAERYFENYEGFDTGDAKAAQIAEIPANILEKQNVSKEQHPRLELLIDLGGKVHSDKVPRIVNFNGKVYTEGHLTYFSIFQQSKNKCGVYIIRIQNTDHFKIGITNDLKKRMSNFATGNPQNLKIEYFVATKHYKSLEKHFHEIFKENRTKGEWFNFNETEFRDLESHLVVLHRSKEFFVHDLKGLYIWLNY